jgi:hypothetical protein
MDSRPREQIRVRRKAERAIASVPIIAISGRHILSRRFLHHELKIIGTRANGRFAVCL